MKPGAMQVAYAVATGQQQLADLRPATQHLVKRIFDSYGGIERVKELATHKPAPIKIGQRATLFRKVR